MALKDDINNLPTAVSDGIPGHLNNHQVIHAGLKSHESQLSSSTGRIGPVADGGKLVSLFPDGGLLIDSESIKWSESPTNKRYVDDRVDGVIDRLYSTERKFIAGTGHPEGRVAASLGTEYTDSASTLGALRWIKTTASGSYGWALTYGNTGWRDVSAMLSFAPSNGNIRVRRRAGVLDIHLNWVRFQYALTVTAELGSSWGGDFSTGTALVDINADPAGTLRLTGGGSLIITRPTMSTYQDLLISIPSTKPWPTAYVGTPA